MFTFENRQLKKGDAVTLIDNIEKNQEYGENKEFLMTSNILYALKRLPSVFYVYFISKDLYYCKVQSKKTAGKKLDILIPREILKIIKVPKMNDIVNWLFDNQLVQYPEQWRAFPNEIQSISRYIVKIFQNNLKAIYLVNKNCNHLYYNNDRYEVLMFYKTLVQQLGITISSYYNKYNQLTIRKKFIDTCLKLNPMWHTLDAISIYDMNNHNVFKDEDYISNDDRLNWYLNPSSKLRADNTKEKKEEVKALIEKYAVRNLAERTKNDKRYISEINQQVIDELELVIFNVKTIPHRNQILFIFIDKDNNKRFFIDNFEFIFYVSNVSNIIENDYIVNFNKDKHIPFIVKNFEVLRNLKFAINDNHKRFMKKGSF